MYAWLQRGGPRAVGYPTGDARLPTASERRMCGGVTRIQWFQKLDESTRAAACLTTDSAMPWHVNWTR
jgi:hypothetical protein